MTAVAALCAGYGGLELGLTLAGYDLELVWYAETDPAASAVMHHHHPDTPNLGDITLIESPPHADIVTAGFPCQPVSVAGQRQGTDDHRWLIDDVCKVARSAEASTLVLENVGGLLTANNGDAMARVCAAMALNGFDRWRWTTLRASDIGATHRRERWFCVAHADIVHVDRAKPLRESRRPEPTDSDRRTRPMNLQPEKWGRYAEAIARHETVLGRPAPEPTVNGRLSPRFVEWMMMLPAGHVTGLDIPRTQQLRILGNGVVPQQAAAAIQALT